MNSIRLLRELKRVGQYFNRPEVAVVGGYHMGNLGDVALGESIVRMGNSIGVKSAMQNIYNLNKWAKVNKVIVGGGAVTYSDSMDRLFSIYDPEHVSICGVDIEDYDYVDSHLNNFKSLEYFSVRNSAQYEVLRNVYGLSNVTWHPDIVFSLLEVLNRNFIKHKNDGGKYAVLNICPRYSNAKADSIVEDNYLKGEYTYAECFDKYSRCMRFLSEDLINRGYRIVHVPFTPQDNIAARNVLRGIEYEEIKYTTDIELIFTLYRNSSFSIPCRYHSLIFSVCSNIPYLGFLYAEKSHRLTCDINMNPHAFFTINDLMSDEVSLSNRIDMALDCELMTNDYINNIYNMSKEGVMRSYDYYNYRCK